MDFTVIYYRFVPEWRKFKARLTRYIDMHMYYIYEATRYKHTHTHTYTRAYAISEIRVAIYCLDRDCVSIIDQSYCGRRCRLSYIYTCIHIRTHIHNTPRTNTHTYTIAYKRTRVIRAISSTIIYYLIAQRQVYLRAPRKGRSIKCGNIAGSGCTSPMHPLHFLLPARKLFSYSCSVKDSAGRKYTAGSRNIAQGILTRIQTHTHTRTRIL